MGLWPKHSPDWRRAAGLELRTEKRRGGAGPAAWKGVLSTLRFPVARPEQAGMRLLFFSDLHWDREDDTWEGLAEIMNGLAPDWLLFGGDLARRRSALPSAVRFLGRLTARRGRLAVLGNWEARFHSPAEWREILARAGFDLLVNEIRPAPESGAPAFIGLDDSRCGTPDPRCGAALARHPGLVVGLMHSPVAAAESGGAFLGQLLLAGHTHGGQIRIPGIGALTTSTPYGVQFDRGLFRRRADGAWLAVSQGLGATGAGILRRRIFCPPELLLVETVTW